MEILRNIFDLIVNPNEHKNKGSSGERLIYMDLTGAFSNIFDEDQILRNVYIKKKNGRYTEVDLLAVTTKGIFVIESKNYSGWIFGSEWQKEWTQIFKGGKRVKFYNPIMQNDSHIKALMGELGGYKRIQYQSLIVFSERCEIKSMAIKSPNISVIKRNDLNKEISQLYKNMRDCITRKEQIEIVAKLSILSRPKEEIRKQHIEGLHKYSKK